MLNRRKLREINQSRPHLAKAEYIKLLVEKGFDKQHVEVVHDEIRDFVQMDDFSIYPEDDIHKIYGIDDLDDIELIEKIRKKLNLRKTQDKDYDELDQRMKSFNAEYILSLTKILKE